MSVFHPLRIRDIQKTTKDCSVIQFDVPSELNDMFSYKQGQYLTLRTTINGEDVRRSYSLCSSPLDDDLKVAVKQITGGVFSTFVNNELTIGETLEVMPPSGEFYVDIDPLASKNYIAFAAGSGITPILSIIKTHLISEPCSTFKLFYVNRTAKSVILKEEIEKIKNQFINRFQVFYFLTKEQRDIPFLNGRFSSEKLQLLIQSFIDIMNTDDCFICGPKEMIFLIRDEMQTAGLAKEKIHYELFFSGKTIENDKRIAEVLEQKVEGTEVTIIDGSKEFHFVMDEDYDNILDGALAAGADLPFACKGGVCSTCKCRVLEGSVEMKINYALDDNEVAQKLVLSCQAVPISEKVIVDFDV
ncbi:2Fe-2S iron-sulfur cluster-binding protein [Maribacter sp. 2308TA10-17]|uniref:2Fe-2S iron-sulfur cluster-binding protein n=1 Tax=Maribacter sp. 2308TA10-17 TaxID=3386276 RepID=UPI0039BC3CA9